VWDPILFTPETFYGDVGKSSDIWSLGWSCLVGDMLGGHLNTIMRWWEVY